MVFAKLLKLHMCVKLHNICTRRWKARNMSATVNATSDPFDDIPRHVNAISAYEFGGEIYLEDSIRERLLNQYEGTGGPKNAENTLRRLLYCNRIAGKGISIVAEDDFLDH